MIRTRGRVLAVRTVNSERGRIRAAAVAVGHYRSERGEIAIQPSRGSAGGSQLDLISCSKKNIRFFSIC